MLNRCYGKSYQSRNPNYYGCTVDKKWLSFTEFKSWMENQDWKGKQLDKDIKIIGNKIYSSETCLFVTQKINVLLINSKASRGIYPIGVSFDKTSNSFKSECMQNGKKKHLGRFDSPITAHLAYIKFKNKVIEDAANLQENEYIREYLLNHAGLLKESWLKTSPDIHI